MLSLPHLAGRRLYASQRALLHVIPRRWFEVNLWHVRQYNLAERCSERITDDEVRWANIEDLDLLAAVGDRAEIQNRWDQGHKATVFIRDGRVCGWRWFAFGHADQHDWLRVVMDEDDCFGVMTLVDPAYRRQGIARRVALIAYQDLKRAGYRRTLSFVDALNRAPLRTYNANSLSTIGSVFYVRFLGLTFVRIGGIRRIGRWGPDQRLEIHARLLATDSRN